jgi:pilus assembly protein Flp/PilA
VIVGFSIRVDSGYSRTAITDYFGEAVNAVMKTQRRTNMAKQMMKNLLNDESGQDLIEYALVAAVIALGCLAAMRSLAGSIGSGFNTVGNSFSSNV